MKKQQDPCNYCGKTLREQMKGCREITCYRQYLESMNTKQTPEEDKTHFMQVIETSDEEMMSIYMKIPKEAIISMLIECNKNIHGRTRLAVSCPVCDSMAERNLKMEEMLHEAKLQIEYLHGKFEETGTGNSVISRIEQLLSNKK